MPLSPITSSEEAQKGPPSRDVRLPLDPLLTLAVIGLGVCSVFTLRQATRKLIPGDPHYYVDRQAVYLIAGSIFMLALTRIDYSRLRRFKNAFYGALLIHDPGGARGSATAARGPTACDQLPVLLLPGLRARQGAADPRPVGVLVERSRSLRERDTTVRVMVAALCPRCS